MFRRFVDVGWCGRGRDCDIYKEFGGVLVSFMRCYITDLVEINEWFADWEYECGVVACCGYVGWVNRRMGRCVPYFGYGYGEGTVVVMVGVGGCNGSGRGLELHCVWEA